MTWRTAAKCPFTTPQVLSWVLGGDDVRNFLPKVKFRVQTFQKVLTWSPAATSQKRLVPQDCHARVHRFSVDTRATLRLWSAAKRWWWLRVARRMARQDEHVRSIPGPMIMKDLASCRAAEGVDEA